MATVATTRTSDPPALRERGTDWARGYVEAPVTYLTHPDQTPKGYNPPPGSGLPEREGEFGAFTVRVHDGRAIADSLSLDREGFTLVRRASGVRDFTDTDEVKRVYWPEVGRLIGDVTGAAKVVVFDHTVRVAKGAVERGLRAPVHMVHNDYTEASAPRRVRDLLPADEAEARLARRFVEINVWRPITRPVVSEPLGLVDARTIAPRDLVKADLVYADRTGEIYYGSYNPAHRWYAFPYMTPDEAVLIKCFDSARDGRPRFSLHSAFPDPTTPEGAPARESIEARAFAFF